MGKREQGLLGEALQRSPDMRVITTLPKKFVRSQVGFLKMKLMTMGELLHIQIFEVSGG